MSIKVINGSKTPSSLTARDLQVGVLYKQVSVPGNFDTVYTRSLSGSVVWFDNGKIGTDGDSGYLFELAPAGTTVILSN